MYNRAEGCKRTRILAASRIPGRNYNFFSVRDGVNRRQINIQMRLNEPGRQMRQPLVQRHILVLRAFEHLKKYEILGSRILDVMRKRLLYVANVAFLEIHGTGVAVSCENCHSSFASHVILPFIGILVPVQFAQSSGMDDDPGTLFARCRKA